MGPLTTEPPAPDQPWSASRALEIAKAYREGRFVPGADAPMEYLDGRALAEKGICDALHELVMACPDSDSRGLVARLIAERVVHETVNAETPEDFRAMLKIVLDYVEGTPARREPKVDPGESRERVLTVTMRAADWEVVDAVE